MDMTLWLRSGVGPFRIVGNNRIVGARTRPTILRRYGQIIAPKQIIQIIDVTLLDLRPAVIHIHPGATSGIYFSFLPTLLLSPPLVDFTRKPRPNTTLIGFYYNDRYARYYIASAPPRPPSD
jgi:hypothetical protein